MSNVVRAIGPDALITGGVRLLTPPFQSIYALLVRAGLLVIDD